MEDLYPDADILAGFRQGNTEAFTYVYNLHYKRLRYFADQLVINHQEARDIVADSFIKLFQRKNDFDSLQSIRSFLYVTTRNACIDFYRFQERNSRMAKQLQYLNPDHESEYVFQSEIKAGVLDEIYKEIDNLPVQCKKVFTLMYFKGLTTSEVAAEMGISIKTVQNQKLNAIRLLRTALLKKDISALTLLYFLAILAQYASESQLQN